MSFVQRTVLAIAAAAPMLLAGITAHAADDIIATAEKAGTFKTLIAAVKAAGLSETLTGKGPLTVFAPTDEAFKKLPAGTLDTWLKSENKATLAQVLKYHVLPGAYSSERLAKARSRSFTVKTAEGSGVLFDKRNGLTIAGARIAKTDIGASNGTIHVIDAVLLPAAVKRTLAGSAAGAAAAPAPAKGTSPTPLPADPAKAGQPTGAPMAKPEAPKAGAGKADPAKGAAPATPAAPAPATPAPAKK